LEHLPEALLQSSDAFFGAALTQINEPGETGYPIGNVAPAYLANRCEGEPITIAVIWIAHTTTVTDP
jgi:hypothetical protein